MTDAAEPAETPDPYGVHPRRDEAHLTELHRYRTRRRTRDGEVGRLAVATLRAVRRGRGGAPSQQTTMRADPRGHAQLPTARFGDVLFSPQSEAL